MNREQYAELNKKYSSLRATNFRGLFHFVFETILTGLAFWLSLHEGWLFWFVGQALMFVVMWRWFSVLHSCSHDAFFESRLANGIAGHFASVFSLIPYLGWRHTHVHHHQWTGWKDLDPAMDFPSVSAAPGSLKRVMDFCWKYHIPFFSIFFVLKKFWNLQNVNAMKMSRGRKVNNAFSLIFLLAAHVLLAFILRSDYLAVLALPGFLYMSSSDLIVLSQHTRLPLHRSHGENVRAFHCYEQGEFSRSLQYPGWISRFVLLHFDKHSEHHLLPRVPHYFLGRVREPVENPVHWIIWFRHIKALPGHLVALEDKRDTLGA